MRPLVDQVGDEAGELRLALVGRAVVDDEEGERREGRDVRGRPDAGVLVDGSRRPRVRRVEPGGRRVAGELDRAPLALLAVGGDAVLEAVDLGPAEGELPAAVVEGEGRAVAGAFERLVQADVQVAVVRQAELDGVGADLERHGP